MLIIEADMVVQGELTIVGTVILDGRFEGAMSCTRLEIGPDGYLIGTVAADELDVAGQLVGRVEARRIHLRGSALVEGEVRHEQLSMDEAATLVGESRRMRELDMPLAFRQLQARARHAEDDLRQLETESRVRRTEEAIKARPHFETLRARFPAPRVSA